MTASLNNSEEKYYSLFEQASDAIMVSDLNGKLLEVNESTCKMLGYTRAELLKMNASDFQDPGQISKEPLRHDLVVGGTQIMRTRILVSKNGSKIEVEVNAKKTVNNNIIAIARDITNIRKAEKQIALSEATLRGAFDSSAIGMALVSPEGKFIKINKELCRITGYSEEELLNLSFRAITHPDDVAKDLAFLQGALQGNLTTYKVEKRYIHKSKSVVWVSLHSSLVRDGQSTPLYFISQVEDITEKKVKTLELLHEKTLSDTLINGLPGIFYLIDTNRRFLRWNKNLETITGYSAEEIAKMQTPDFLLKSEVDEINKKREIVIKEGKADTELTIVTKDKRHLHFYLIALSIVHNEQPCVLGMA